MAPTAPQPPPARSLLATVLGDLVLASAEPAWNAAIVDVMAAFGVEGTAVRQALARAASRGFVASTKVGRSAAWSLTPRGHRFIEGGLARLAEFEAGPPDWDGRWIVLQTTLSGADRTVRRHLYARLGQLRFGNPSPGTWVSPWTGQLAELRSVLQEYGLESSSQVFVGENAGFVSDPQLAEQSWDLTSLTDTYRSATRRFARSKPTSPAATLTDFVALRTEVMALMWSDPLLPPELTPDRSGREFALLSHSLSEKWRPTAEAEWHRLVTEHEPAAHRASRSRRQ
jgi:phenylacetic acid degradation operon negative regulatory protein